MAPAENAKLLGEYRLETYNDPESNKSFYLSSASKKQFVTTWPKEAVANMLEKINFDNMFVVAEDEEVYQIKHPRFGTERNLPEIKNYDKISGFKNRVMIEQEIKLTSTSKKARDVLQEKFSSATIASFISEFNKNSPKPYDKVAQAQIEVRLHFL